MKSRDQTFQSALDPTIGQYHFEESRVKLVLEAFGLADKKWELLEAHNQEFGSHRLTFAGFRRHFPTFPVVLDARHVGGLVDAVERRDLFRRPDRVFMTDLYLEAYAKHADEAGDRPVGLVLPFGGSAAEWSCTTVRSGAGATGTHMGSPTGRRTASPPSRSPGCSPTCPGAAGRRAPKFRSPCRSLNPTRHWRRRCSRGW